MNNHINEETLRKINKADKIIIGLSGGADSVALTHILFKSIGPDKLICAHLNHMLRGDEALRDEEFSVNYAKSLDIACKVKRLNIAELAELNGESTEECGRHQRYLFFNELYSGNYLIATAHNANDSAETVLLNIARGTGLKGLCGIPKVRGNIIRPILDMTRHEIESYCKENSLCYITDSSNLTNDYDRNFVRNNVLPVLTELNTAATQNINRLSSLIYEDNLYLEKTAKMELERARCSCGLRVQEINELPYPILSRVLIEFIGEIGKTRLEKKHIDGLVNIAKNNGTMDISGGIRVKVSQGFFTAEKKQKKVIINFLVKKQDVESKEWSFGSKKLKISLKNRENQGNVHNLLFENFADYDKIGNVLDIGNRKIGDKFTFKNRGLSKSLKKLFIEEKIPSSIRDKLIVVRDEDSVIFVEGIGISAEYSADNKTKKLIYFEIN